MSILQGLLDKYTAVLRMLNQEDAMRFVEGCDSLIIGKTAFFIQCHSNLTSDS